MVRYGQSALATVADFGGELLAGTREYRPLKDLRINELTRDEPGPAARRCHAARRHLTQTR
jgi:hypothetical protein